MATKLGNKKHIINTLMQKVKIVMLFVQSLP